MLQATRQSGKVNFSGKRTKKQADSESETRIRKIIAIFGSHKQKQSKHENLISPLFALLVGMVSCGGHKTESLDGTVWKLTAMENIPEEAIAAEADAFTLEFNAADTVVYGRTNCNRFFGKYEDTKHPSSERSPMATTGELHFGNLGATRMMCPDMEYETAFLQMLGQVNLYAIQDGELTLYGGDSDSYERKPLATFRPTTLNEANEN